MQYTSFALLRQNIKQDKAQVEMVLGLFVLLFAAVFLYAFLQKLQWQNIAWIVEDALDDALLGCAVLDLGPLISDEELVIADPTAAYNAFYDILATELSLDADRNATAAGLGLENVRVETFILYNVNDWERRVSIYYFTDGSLIQQEEKTLGSVYAPTGEEIATTSLYAKITFSVKGIFDLYVDGQRGRLVDIVINDP